MRKGRTASKIGGETGQEIGDEIGPKIDGEEIEAETKREDTGVGAEVSEPDQGIKLYHSQINHFFSVDSTS